MQRGSILVLALAGALFLCSNAAKATPPSDSAYWVGFVAGDHPYLYRERADGTGLAQLVPGQEPLWSPTGKDIAFVPNTSSGPPQLDVLELASGSVHVIATGALAPAWSPDGSRLAYERTDGALVSIRTDGRDAKVLDPTQSSGNGASNHWCQVWSPDASMVATLTTSPYSAPAQSGTTQSLRVVRADGSGLVGQIPGVALACPTWSPNSAEIAYTTTINYSPTLSNTSLQVGRPDGSGIRALTQDGYCAGDSDPLWSHDGRRIAYRRAVPLDANSPGSVGGSHCDAGQGGIWFIDPQGAKETQVLPAATTGTNQSGSARGPDPRQWSSDDRLVLYVDQESSSACDGCETFAMGVLASDGSGHHLLAEPAQPGGPQDPVPTLAPLGATVAGTATGPPTTVSSSGTEARGVPTQAGTAPTPQPLGSMATGGNSTASPGSSASAPAGAGQPSASSTRHKATHGSSADWLVALSALVVLAAVGGVVVWRLARR